MRLLLAIIVALLLAQTPCLSDDGEAMRHARQSYEFSKSGDLEHAEAEMKQAISAAPQNALLHSGLGGILSRRGRLVEARESFARAVELDGNPTFRLQLALKQWETGQLESARDNLLSLVSGGNADEQARKMLEAVSLDWGAMLGKQARWKAGLAVAKDTASRFPESAAAWQMRGFFETKSQENVSAVSSYQRATELDPSCTDCVIGLAMAQSAAGRSGDATRTFEIAASKWPRLAVVHQAYGVHLLRVSDAEPQLRSVALEQLRKAVELDGQLVEAQFQLGNSALESGDLDVALRHLQQAAESSQPVPAKVYYALGRAWRRAGNVERAAAAMRRFEEQKQKEQP